MKVGFKDNKSKSKKACPAKSRLAGRSGGFSLIELLIVITIIGVLSSIVLSSLSNSRARAYDSKVKQQLSSFRTAAEIYFSNNGDSYGPPAADCAAVGSIFTNVQPQNGTPGIYIAPGNLPDFAEPPTCQSTNSAYAVKASLYSGNEYWCVDSKGFSGLIPGLITGPTTICP